MSEHITGRPQPIASSGGSPKPLERVMIFIDGGYIRRKCRELFGDDNISYWKLRNDLQHMYNIAKYNHFRANLIRAYYYDGIADASEEEYEEHKEYLDRLKEECLFLEVRTADAVKKGDGRFEQKGVDVLLAILKLPL